MQKASYLVPAALVGLLAWFGKPSWWAVAMLAGGAMFAWDYLWGDPRVLQASYGIQVALVGALVLAIAFALALGLGMSLGDFQATAKGLSRRERFLYNLPSLGIGIALYGLLVWSRARDR